MQKILILFSILFLSAALSAAPVEKPLLYKITKDGISSYMLGTIHIQIDFDDLPKVVHQKFEQAEMFAMETNLNAITPDVMKFYQLYPEGDSLRNYISEEAFKLLTMLIPDVPAERLETLRPWFLQSNLIKILSSSSKEGTGGLDLQLQAAAKESGKTLSYMESWVHQFEVLDKMTTPESLESLIMYLAEQMQRSNPLQQMLDYYKAGNQEGLCTMIQAQGEAANEILLYERNRNWIGLIDMMHYNYENAFMAVGAGHFCGEQGVLQLLEKRGYTVERVLE